MIKCKLSPAMCNHDGMCCSLCEIKTICEYCCGEVEDGNQKDCKFAYAEYEQTDLTVFQQQTLAVMQRICELDTMKKKLEEEDKQMREQLQKAMDAHGIRQFENDILKITYVEPTTRESIDSKALKADLPAIAAKYTKVSNVKGSVRITVK